MERVWKKLRENLENVGLKKALKVMGKMFKRVKGVELQNFIHKFTVRTAEFVGKKDGAGLHHNTVSIKPWALEGKKQSNSTYVRSATGELLRDKQSYPATLKGVV